MQDAKNRHLGTIAQLCRAIALQLRHVSTIGIKLVKQRYVVHMSPQCGELRPTNGWDPSGSLRHRCKFQRFLRLGSITARHLVLGVSQILRRSTEGATCVRQGNNHVGHWLHSSFFWFIFEQNYLCFMYVFCDWQIRATFCVSNVRVLTVTRHV